MARTQAKPKEGLRASGAPDLRSEVEKSRGADDMVTVAPITGSYRVGGKMYNPGDTEIPKSLAAALGLIGKYEPPLSDPLREGPEFAGGPDVKEAQETQRSLQQAAAGQGGKR